MLNLRISFQELFLSLSPFGCRAVQRSLARKDVKEKLRNFHTLDFGSRFIFYVANVYFFFPYILGHFEAKKYFLLFNLPYIIKELIKSIHIHKQGLRYPFSTRSQKESKLNFLLFTFYLFLTVESVMCSKWLDIVLEGRRVLHCTVVWQRNSGGHTTHTIKLAT